MTNTAINEKARVLELLAGEALGDLDPGERVELHARRSGHSLADDGLMRTAGLAQLAFLKTDSRAPARMPESLRARLKSQADTWSASVSVLPGPRSSASKTRLRSDGISTRTRLFTTRAGWSVAAGLAVVLIATLLRLPPAEEAATLAQQRVMLLEEADTVRIAWAPGAAGYESVKGDVVWNSRRQKGFLRIEGLPANDSRRAQYQLWIVAPDRDSHPVDGGIFDAKDGEFVAEIDPKLDVGRPTVFAITLEKPGGVVVSDRPILAAARLQS